MDMIHGLNKVLKNFLLSKEGNTLKINNIRH